METQQTKTINKEDVKQFTPISSLSWEEASELLSFPKPNTDGFFEQMQERDKRLKEQVVQNPNLSVQTQ